MSLSVDGVWKAGVWATTVWADGVWREGSPTPPAPTPPDQASNWQAHYWVHSKRRTKKEEREERIRLGIIEPDVEVLEQAVVQAAQAQEQEGEEAQAQVLEAERLYKQIYREAFKEFYRAEEVARLFREEVEAHRKQIRRRAAWLLLLH